MHKVNPQESPKRKKKEPPPPAAFSRTSKKTRKQLPEKLHYFEDFKAEDYDHLLISDPAKVALQLSRELENSREWLLNEKDKETWQTAKECMVPQKDRFLTKRKYKEDPRLVEAVGLASMKGKRSSMEDAHLVKIVEVLVNETILTVPIFAIFDGHGGKGCAKFLEKNLARQLKINLPIALKEFIDVHTALYNCLVFTINQLNDLFKLVYQSNTSGSTATIAVVFKGTIYLANVGDSRAILCNNQEPPIALSTDAKLGIERFEESIDKRGGVILGGRVGGAVQVARALGDKGIEGMPARPLITSYQLPTPIPEGLRLVIACDGLWNVGSSSQIAKEIDLKKEASLEEIAEHLIGKGYSAGSSDNISALIVNLSRLPAS